MAINDKIKLIEQNEESIYSRLSKCDICPRNCKINRIKGEGTYCGTKKNLIIYTVLLHPGEEPAISGKKGSGTIFFSGCNLKCAYCQNYKFSHFIKGKRISEADLAKIMINLQKKGANNINLVTPTHFLPQILKSLKIAFKKGLTVPIVYNTSGYEKAEIITLLKGIIDIYLTDIKYMNSSLANKYSKASNYPDCCKKSVKEMYQQQPEPIWSESLLKKGLIIRHLVIPNHIQESKEILLWIKQNAPEALTSVMFQYRPYFKANLYPEINRSLTFPEYKNIKEFCEEIELKGWIQDFNTSESLLAGPYFKQDIHKFTP